MATSDLSSSESGLNSSDTERIISSQKLGEVQLAAFLFYAIGWAIYVIAIPLDSNHLRVYGVLAIVGAVLIWIRYGAEVKSGRCRRFVRWLPEPVGVTPEYEFHSEKFDTGDSSDEESGIVEVSSEDITQTEDGEYKLTPDTKQRFWENDETMHTENDD